MRLVWWIVVAVGLVLLTVAMFGTGDDAALDGDSAARLLYLGIFGAAVAAGILASGRIGSALRHLALWLVVVLVFVGGYQYRYELQDIAHRLTAGLVPGSPISVGAVEGRTAVMIQQSPGGHFETRAMINGAPVNFLLDTGATVSVLSARDAEAAGFNLSTLNFDVPIATANGITTAARAGPVEIAVGDIVRPRQPLLIASPGQLRQSLLGMSFLSSLTGYDVRGNRIVLID
jgi:aspartyl protease family protein